MAVNGDFVVGKRYYGSAQVPPAKDFVGIFKREDVKGRWFTDYFTGKLECRLPAPYYEYFECEEEPVLPPETGAHLYLAFQVTNGVGMGTFWQRFFANKYGFENVVRQTNTSTTVDRVSREVAALEYFQYNARGELVLGRDLMEDRGRFNYRNCLDFEPPELKRAQKIQALWNIIAHVMQLNTVIRVMIQDEKILVEYRTWRRDSNVFDLGERYPFIEPSIRELNLNIGTYTVD